MDKAKDNLIHSVLSEMAATLPQSFHSRMRQFPHGLTKMRKGAAERFQNWVRSSEITPGEQTELGYLLSRLKVDLGRRYHERLAITTNSDDQIIIEAAPVGQHSGQVLRLEIHP